ncbi:MAG: tetratricopeptide repeat protein [Pseudomonadota bacterium]|nr:tetratricopeptide repeat protein [Pseudomonadota bacterium]
MGLLLMVAVFVWPDRDPGATAPAPAEASIAVLPFTSLSSDRDDGYFAQGLAIEMHDALAGVSGLKVAAQPAGDGALAGSDVKTLGEALGVATVLAATVRREGHRVRVNARLSDTRTGFTLWSETYDRDVTDVFAVQREMAYQVVQALLGVLPGGRSHLDQRLSPTDDVIAYDAYLKGLQQLQGAGTAERHDRAIDFFGQALAADPEFARAQAGICRAEIGNFERARDAPAFARAQATCGRAARMDAELREVSLALGELHRVRGEDELAIGHYTRALDDLALRPAAYIGLARLQSDGGNNQLALDYFQRARQLRPGDSVIYRELGYHHYLNDDLPQAIESFRAAATLQPEDAGAWSSLGGVYLAHGDAERAADAFSRSLAITPSYGALSNLGTLRYGEGKYAEAAALYQRAAALDPDDYRIWGNIGDALAAAPGNAEGARAFYQRAAAMASSYVDIKTNDAQALGLLAWYRANLGESDAAREALAQAETLPGERGEVALLGAQTLALLGDPNGARERMAQAEALGVSSHRIDAAPVLRKAGLAGGERPVAQ